jgi:succinate dehydrogenase / fumarate reductase, cytochrome b subunit
MNWFSNFITSSIGQKLVMSLTGLFLIIFLVIHLIGNLQLLNDDNGESFNVYAYFMTHNPVIISVSYGLYFFILLHAILGIVIAIRNRKARGPKRYAVQTTSNTGFASRNMALLGSLIFVFLVIHMGNFWYQMKFTNNLPMIRYEGYSYDVKDLYQRVSVTFTQVWFVVLYVISMVVLAFHLLHGFQSAFQTLGWNHRKYTPILRVIGIIYAIVVPIAFAIIPIAFYLQNK